MTPVPRLRLRRLGLSAGIRASMAAAGAGAARGKSRDCPRLRRRRLRDLLPESLSGCPSPPGFRDGAIEAEPPPSLADWLWRGAALPACRATPSCAAFAPPWGSSNSSPFAPREPWGRSEVLDIFVAASVSAGAANTRAAKGARRGALCFRGAMPLPCAKIGVSTPPPLPYRAAHYLPLFQLRSGGALMGNRLTVDPRTLTPLVLVRIQVPQPAFLSTDALPKSLCRRGEALARHAKEECRRRGLR